MRRALAPALASAVVFLAAVSGACTGQSLPGPGGSGPAAPLSSPHPLGETADVGGWLSARTWLTSKGPLIEAGEGQPGASWRVTVTRTGRCSPVVEAMPTPPRVPGSSVASAPPTPAPSSPEGPYFCALVTLENTGSGPGALDLVHGGPVLVTTDDTRYPVAGVRMETGPFSMAASLPGSMTSASTCSFSAPDAQGRQSADCATMLTARSDGTAFEEALVAVGAGRAVALELAFAAPPGTSASVVEWPGGTRFAPV